MRDTVTRYYLAGIRIPRSVYRRFGWCVPERLRDVRTA